MNMKKYIYAAILATGLFSFSSCVNDLDVVPLDETVNTADKAYTSAEDYANALSKIYAIWAMSGQNGAGSSDISLGDAGNTTLIRSWWTCQEQPTDEMKNAWGDSWCTEINYMNWGTSKIEVIEAVYQRCMYIVALVNDFLKNTPNAPAEVDRASYEAQARFCRALAYYVLMDVYARPPFITEDNYSLQPSQLDRAELFNWIERELMESVIPNLPARSAGADRGRADQGSAYALLARMYLNAEVYTGSERYTDCVKACKEVIGRGYILASQYSALFSGDNSENPDAYNEIIFPVMVDGDVTQSYANSLIIGARPSQASKEVEGSDDSNAKFKFFFQNSGVREGWGGYRATGQLVDMFEFADKNNPTAGTIKDSRGIFVSTTYQGVKLKKNIEDVPKGTFLTAGWWVYKFTNLDHEGNPPANKEASATLFTSTDFPLFRLGDIYLMYAESVARGGQGGDMGTAVSYVNRLRQRGGVSDINESWLKATVVIGNATVPYGNLLNERGRELYWEGIRRTDLIRYNLFTSSQYLWDWKGGQQAGVGVNDRYKLYPIPLTDLTSNSSLEQNEGYK